MVGLHNLYWYYGSQTYYEKNEKNQDKLLYTAEAFQGYDLLVHDVSLKTRHNFAINLSVLCDMAQVLQCVLVTFSDIISRFFSLYWSLF